MQKTPDQRRKGFTLIELLVVIAIIAILAAILFPVLAQARKSARVTQTISNVKQINLGIMMYNGDFDDTFPLWSAGMGCTPALCPPRPGTSDAGSVFDLRFMYPSLVGPYIKNGVNTTTGALTDIWASPNTKPLLSAVSNTFAYNHWTLGGFSSCARTIDLANMPGSCTRTATQYGEYADGSYNFPASVSSIASPATLNVILDGAQLSRPPQYAIAFPGEDPWFIGVWGPHDLGRGPIRNLVGPSTQNATRQKLMSGKKTVVAYADGHVKAAVTSTLYHQNYSTPEWRGARTDNRFWSREHEAP